MKQFVVLQKTLTIDALPEDGQKVIFYIPSENEIEAGYYDAKQEVFIVGIEGAVGYQQGKVSLWMPFPEPTAVVNLGLHLI